MYNIRMNKYLVEFLGTMFLVYVIFATGNWLAIGAALAIAVMLGGPVSGGAFNPAVAIAQYNAGSLMKNDLIPYILAQILGGITAYYVYKRYVNTA
jgi:glycerol uptake facilitator-like aquaporin